MGNFIIELEALRRSYRVGTNVIDVLSGVDFRLESGRWCCIYGASGSGKTTLLNLIGALEKPDGGTIKIAGEDVTRLGRRAAAHFRAREIGFIFQAYHLLPELSILENTALAARLNGVGVKAATERAEKLLCETGLAERLNHRPAELSGGEQQRAAIARALVNSPRLLLADEPTGNLDQKTGKGILELFQALRERNPERSIVMITHNRDIASMATDVVELADGKLNSVSVS